MSDKQSAHPNLKRGGTNPNAGRPKAAFRLAAGKAALEQISHWIAVAKGNKCIRVPGFGGAKGTLRHPTHDEQERAYRDVLLRYGIGTQDEVTVLGSTEVFDALADVLPEFAGRTLDEETIDAILAAVGGRLDGTGQ